MEERERKRALLEAELEEKRRAEERKHEERMQLMLFNFMQGIMSFTPSFSPAMPVSTAPTPCTPYPHFAPSSSVPPFPPAAPGSSRPPMSSTPSFDSDQEDED